MDGITNWKNVISSQNDWKRQAIQSKYRKLAVIVKMPFIGHVTSLGKNKMLKIG